MSKIGRPPLLILLTAMALAHAAAAAPVPQRGNARQVLRIVESAYEDTMRAAQASGSGLDARTARNRPFWSALDRVGVAVEDVGRALRARDERFFQALERGSRALGELRVVWSRAGVRSREVEHGVRLLSSSFRLLRGSYGSEHLRSRRGGGLTAAERQRFERIQAVQARFAERLEALERKAAARRDRTTAAEMARLLTEAERIASAPMTVNAYLNALIASDEMQGEWDGNRYYADPVDRQDWLAANAVMEDLYADSQVGHVFALDLGHLDEETELAGDLGDSSGGGGEVQVFQLSVEEEPVFVEPEPVMEVFPEEEEVAVDDVEVLEAEPAAQDVGIVEDVTLEEEPTPVAPEGAILEEDIEDEAVPAEPRIPPPA